MQQFAVTLFLACFLQVVHGQLSRSNFIAIDHVPIVVKNLDSVKNTLSESLHFTVKNGKEHAGINNCFLKFQDGTYLEFTTPIDSSQTIGKHYNDFLKNRQGATSLAVSVKNTDSLIAHLNTNSVAFEADSNRLWKTIEPKGANLFFIDYKDKQWKDSKTNTTHPNTALSLKSVYLFSSDVETEEKKYQSLGFGEPENDHFLHSPCRHLVMGNSHLYILNAFSSPKLQQAFHRHDLTGIHGFEIQTASLRTFNQLLPKTENVTIEKKRTIVYLPDLNLFFVFTE